MPLILAIEPDRRQATQLASLTRASLNAEVLVVDSSSRALEAIDRCVPDVILTSTLLSPRDDATLADRLRDLGVLASHVQTLTIPIFSTDAPDPGPTGVLSAFRRKRRGGSGPAGGCEPAAFAEQLAVYLERATREREVVDSPPSQMLEAAASEPVPSFPTVDETLASMEPVAVVTEMLAAAAAEPAPLFPPLDETPLPVEPVAVVSEMLDAAASATVAPLPAVDELLVSVDPVAVASETLDTAASETVAPLPAVDEIPVSVDSVAVVSETLDTAASETVPLLPAIDEMPVSVDPVAVVSVSQEPLPVIVEVQQEIVAPEELPAVLESAAVPSEPAEGAPNLEDVFVLDPGMINEIECALEVDLSVGLDEIAGGEMEEADGDQEVWTIDRRTLEASGEAADGPAAPIPMEQAAPEPENVGVRSNEDASVSRVVSIGTVTTPLSEPIVKNKGRKKQKPVQDEWGFFDPEQCGFPALLAKLDEIARSEKSEA